MKTILYSVALLISLTLLGCKPKETALSGQVFIVTRGAESIKLGLIEVRLIERQTAKDYIQKKQPVVDAELASRQTNFFSVKSEYEKAKANCAAFLTNNPMTKQNYVDLKEKRVALENTLQSIKEEIISKTAIMKRLRAEADDAIEETLKNANAGMSLQEYKAFHESEVQNKLKAADDYKKTIDDWVPLVAPVALDDENKISQLSKDIDQIELEAKELSKPLQDKLAVTKAKVESLQAIFNDPYPKAETFFSDFAPAVFQKTTTDADGKFTFSYPFDKSLTVCAKGERVVGDKTEKYYWLVNAPSRVEKAQVFLSNNNLVWIDPDGYFKIKPKSEL